MTGSNKPPTRALRVLLCGLFLSLPPLGLSGGIISFEAGYGYSAIQYSDYNGTKIDENADYPLFGFSVSGLVPGWHPRFKILGNYRNFHVRLPSTFKLENSSALTGQLGLQWIFNPIYTARPFIASALKYQTASIKFNYTPLDYTYGYYHFRRISLPLSAGVLFPVYKNLFMSLEAEGDFIALHSVMHRDVTGFTPLEEKPYEEHGFSISWSLGFAY